MVTLHEVELVREALVEGTNFRISISPIASLVYNNILIVKTIAEYCKLSKKYFLIPKFRKSVADAI